MAKPIKIEIIGDTKSIKGAFGEVDTGVGGLQKTMGVFAAAVGGAFAVGAVIDFGTEMFSLASDLELTNRKIATVFGDQADEIAAWADSVNESFGTSSTQVQNMTASVADLIKPMGATTAEAAAMSQEIVGLAPALASWSAGQYDAAEVSEILASAMLGEREQLKGLGISISQAEVNTRALTVATADGRGEVTAMDEALATQQLIFEKSTDAQAGFISGTSTLSGQQAELKAKLTEVKEFVATELTPIFLAAGRVIVDDVVPALTAAWAEAQNLRDRFQELREKVAPFLEQLTPLINQMVDWSKKVRENDTIMSGLKTTLIAVAAGLAAVALIVATGIATGIIIFGAIAVAIGAVVGVFLQLVGTIRENGSKIYDSVTGPFRDAIQWVKDQWASLKKTLTAGVSIPNPFSGITSLIPGRAMGGLATMSGVYDVGERGRERVFLPQGARVQPAHTVGGGGGDTYNIYGATATATELAREIAWRRRVGDGR